MDMEANPEEIQVVMERQNVSNEEAAVELVGALKDQSGTSNLAVRHCTQLTHCANSALRKGHGKMLRNSIRG
jgi:hypothetical protein